MSLNIMGAESLKRRLPCIIVLDDTAKQGNSSYLPEFKSYGSKLVDSFDEITDHDLTQYNSIFITENYPKTTGNLEKIMIYKSLYPTIRFIYLGADSLWQTIMSKYAEVYATDSGLIDYDLINEILYKDTLSLARKVTRALPNTAYKLAEVLYTESSDESVRKVTREYFELRRFIDNLLEENTKLNSMVASLQDGLSKSEKELEEVYEQQATLLLDRVHANKQLADFETILSKGVYEKVKLFNYKKAPIVIYLKELKELVYQNSFINTLRSVIVGQAHLSCKVLRLFSNSEVQLDMIRDNYFVLENRFNKSDITKHDFLARSGNYTRTLQFLFENPDDLDVLIVVDSKGHKDTVVEGSMIYYNLCANIEAVETLGLNKSNTIVTSLIGELNDYLSWPHYPKYNSLKRDDMQGLFAMVSANKAVQEIFTRVSEISDIM